MKIVAAAPHRSPQTMTARRARICVLLDTGAVTSQHELGQLLVAEGIKVTQATLSRDLESIGAVKQIDADGQIRYVTPTADTTRSPGRSHSDLVSRIVADVLVGADAAQNIAVLHTPPGAAHYLAGTLDRSGWQEIVGTVAGDDTVLVVMRSDQAALEFCARLVRVAERAGTTVQTSATGGARQRRSS